MNNSIIKIGLAIVLFLCVFNMPYGYYQFVRFLATIVFSYFAYYANQKSNNSEMFFNVALALLFQPFFKIALGREIWNIIDVIVGIGLLVSLNSSKKLN